MQLSSRFGQDVTKCSLKCSGKGGVQLKSLNPNALETLSSFLSDLKPIKTGDEHLTLRTQICYFTIICLIILLRARMIYVTF